MDKKTSINYKYDEIGDVLNIYFGENRRAWTIELTDNIMISVDRHTEEAVSLTLLDFTELIRPAPVGPRSFPLTGLDTLPPDERELVIKVLTTPPVSDLLDVSSVWPPSARPLSLMHLERRSIGELGLVTVAMSSS